MSDEPEVTFSEWVLWSDRHRLRRDDGPWLGLYLWGQFERAPDKAECPYPVLPSQIIYVGETKNLDDRPLTGVHHRLAHYRDTFPDDGELRRLYVSISRVMRFPDGYGGEAARAEYRRLRVYTQYVEAKIYWEYTKRWHCPPALHYKKPRKGSLR